MEFQTMSIDQLGEVLHGYDLERLALRDKARKIMALRNQKIAADNAADHGLTTHEYDAAKDQATDKNPLQDILRKHRRDRALQVVKTQPATVRTQVVK